MNPQTTSRGNTTHKTHREFGNPVSDPKPNLRFVPIPLEVNKPDDLTYPLTSALSKRHINKIIQSQKIVFHCVGDTGGVHGTETQDALAYQMEKQFARISGNEQPSFFYHLGDVVYYNGLKRHYEDQFYDPYKYYPSIILAIPGNHDCDTQVWKGGEPDNEPSLAGFVENFCDRKRRPVPYSPYRYSMNQPYPYWMLDAPFVTIIGLFSNVDGSLDSENDTNHTQFNWFVEQLKNAPKDKCLIVAVHHPCFSLDTVHGGYLNILNSFDSAIKKANRHPDVVFSGHVHNYQRFTRKHKEKHYPYVVAGAGGYANEQRSLHRLQRDQNNELIVVPFQTTHKDLTLEYYNQSVPGFLKITIDAQFLTGEYYTNTWDGSKPPANADDIFNLNWKNNQLL